MTLACNCLEKAPIFYYEDAQDDFYKHIKKIDSSGWFELYQCEISGQYWRIDVWDKGQERFVVKIDDVESWKIFDVSSRIKDIIMKNRGGTVDKKCAWANCKNNRIKDVAYCIDHLYENGIRR